MVKSTLKFIKNNFLRLFLYSLVPALLLGVFARPAGVLTVLKDYAQISSRKFSDIFLAVTGFGKWGMIIVGILAYIVICVVASAMMGSIERKMRFGVYAKPTIATFFKQVNDNLLALLALSASIFVIFTVVNSLNAVLIYFWASVLSTPAVTLVMSILSIIVLYAIAGVWTTYLLFIIPNMTIKGLSFTDSYLNSIRQTSKIYSRLFLAVFVPLAVLFIPLILNYLFMWKLGVLFSAIIYLFLVMYLPVLVYTAFFESEEIDRADIENK